jgi:hypothetical protein
VGQLWELAYGLLPSGEKGFDSKEEFTKAYWRHRAQLFAEVSWPFMRPFAFWSIEHGFQPRRGDRDHSESERELLIELRCELTPQEKAILAKERDTSQHAAEASSTSRERAR